MPDDEDEMCECGTGTSVSMSMGQVAITVQTSAGWTPEMIDHTLTRMSRQLVHAVNALGLVGPAAPEGDG